MVWAIRMTARKISATIPTDVLALAERTVAQPGETRSAMLPRVLAAAEELSLSTTIAPLETQTRRGRSAESAQTVNIQEISAPGEMLIPRLTTGVEQRDKLAGSGSSAWVCADLRRLQGKQAAERLSRSSPPPNKRGRT